MPWIVKVGWKKGGWLAVVLAAAMGWSGCSASDSGTNPAGKAATLPGYIDFPKPGQAVTGNILSFGWAVSKDGVRRVTATIDQKYPMNCTYGTSRPDVNKVVPGFPSGDNPGWNCTLDAAAVPAGNHEITVDSESNKGEIRRLGSVPIVTH